MRASSLSLCAIRHLEEEEEEEEEKEDSGEVLAEDRQAVRFDRREGGLMKTISTIKQHKNAHRHPNNRRKGPGVSGATHKGPRAFEVSSHST
ncbi:hypothetical protein CRENBAI_013430 [Crenichthys baileyi]|uniref:Uncharacterized protein n=1 Tax=Crenichthys baileyi TaxID=28760 RepID=A0AAV9SQD7_9TELE